jgi:hypothetical protein
MQADEDELDVEVLQHCLELVTRLTYATNQRFLKYSERLSRAGYTTCEAFATSGRMYDALWFTPAIRADVALLRVHRCGDEAYLEVSMYVCICMYVYISMYACIYVYV